MASQPAVKKKQSGKTTTIQEALEARGGGIWYAPKATPHLARIWLRKACNSIYAPFVFVAPAVVDQRCNYIEPKTSMGWEPLAALLTSTIFAFSLEINGSASMGAGALEAPTTKLRQYPVFDPRILTTAEKQQLLKLAREVWKDETPVDWLSNTKPGPKLEALDAWLLKQTGSGVTTKTLYNDLAEACAGRIAVAQDKVRTTKKKQLDNLTNVAQGIADQVRPLLNARRFPENFLTDLAQPFQLHSTGKHYAESVYNPFSTRQRSPLAVIAASLFCRKTITPLLLKPLCERSCLAGRVFPFPPIAQPRRRLSVNSSHGLIKSVFA